MAKNVFVLVHPAWHGAWCWERLVPLLREAGHEVFTPTLTGLGDRSHLVRPDTGLETHVKDVINVLTYEDLSDIVLVGHSSSGAVITGVADVVPDRISNVVYLDAFGPEHGQSVFDLLPAARRQVLENLAKTEGGGWLLPRFAPPAWEIIVRDMWGVRDPDDLRWMSERLGPTPLRHFTDGVGRSNPVATKLQRTYIRCPEFPNPRFDQHAEMARTTPNWSYRELPASHHPFVTMPRKTADLLLELRF